MKANSSKVKQELKSITLIILCVFAFRSVFFEPFRIPSGSMIPTLMIGDFILVNKFSYGFKVPFSQFFGNPIYVAGQKKPKRGDVVVFKYPEDTSINFIKRVIGVPGDTVEVINKVVFINGEPVPRTEVDGKEIMSDMDDKFKGYNFKFYNSKLDDNEFKTQIHQNTGNYYRVSHDAVTVPEGQYFVMGDNRDFSHDSRFWGFVPFKNIKGKAILVWFSMIIPFGEHDFKFRPWRIGNLIN